MFFVKTPMSGTDLALCQCLSARLIMSEPRTLWSSGFGAPLTLGALWHDRAWLQKHQVAIEHSIFDIVPRNMEAFENAVETALNYESDQGLLEGRETMQSTPIQTFLSRDNHLGLLSLFHRPAKFGSAWALETWLQGFLLGSRTQNLPVPYH